MFITISKTKTNSSTTSHVYSNNSVSYSYVITSMKNAFFYYIRKFVLDNAHHDKEIQQLYNKVNNLANDKYHHRLFAVIQIGNEQRKVTTEDIICKVDEFHPTIGDRIRFEKVHFFEKID